MQGATAARVLGRYELGPRAGVGSAGSVFRARDVQGGADVVIKFFDGQEDGYAPWVAELRLVARFKHPHIVPCLGAGYDEGFGMWALVFAPARGGSLRRALAAGRRFSAEQTIASLSQIAAALAYAHGLGVVHRDVKPENILAQDEDEQSPWLLTDFGAGRYLSAGQVARSPAGSAEYMAPEVWQGQATALSDQYSLGVLGMELLLGHIPLEKERNVESPPRLEVGDVSTLWNVLARLVSPDPSARFPDMTQVQDALQQAWKHMKTHHETVELLRTYLRNTRGESEAQIERLIAEWGERGSFTDFLVTRNLLPRTTARALDAIHKGYLDVTPHSVLGIAPLPGSTTAPTAAPPSDSPAPTAGETPNTPPPRPPTRVESPVQPPPASPTSAAQEPSAAQAARPQTPPPVAAQPAAPPPATPQTPMPQPPSPVPASPPSPVRPRAGLRLGRYVLQEALGEGATATVFRSFHEILQIPVAIKVFEPIDAQIDPEGAQRFRREAQTLVRLEHPHIVRILDVDIIDGLPLIVMEYVGETTLATLIQNVGRLPAQRLAQIGLAVADALEVAARGQLLHRDVKPSNILERKDGHIKLVDFGIASGRTDEGMLTDPQARQGLVSGTPAYIAPEQAQRPGSIDFRADMYSLGATLYHGAVGRPPFTRSTAYDLMLAHIHDEPTPINHLDPAFDPHLAWTIHRMLRKRPEERFASWAELKEALSQTLLLKDQGEIIITGSVTSTALPKEPAAVNAGMVSGTAAAASGAGQGIRPEPSADAPRPDLAPILASSGPHAALGTGASAQSLGPPSTPAPPQTRAPAVWLQQLRSLPPAQQRVAAGAAAILTVLLIWVVWSLIASLTGGRT